MRQRGLATRSEDDARGMCSKLCPVESGQPCGRIRPRDVSIAPEADEDVQEAAMDFKPVVVPINHSKYTVIDIQGNS